MHWQPRCWNVLCVTKPLYFSQFSKHHGHSVRHGLWLGPGWVHSGAGSDESAQLSRLGKSTWSVRGWKTRRWREIPLTRFRYRELKTQLGFGVGFWFLSCPSSCSRVSFCLDQSQLCAGDVLLWLCRQESEGLLLPLVLQEALGMDVSPCVVCSLVTQRSVLLSLPQAAHPPLPLDELLRYLITELNTKFNI